MRIRAAMVVPVALGVVLAACGDNADPEPAATPQEALTRLIGYIADDKGEQACASMIVAAREKFGPDNDAKDCETAVSSLSSRITDKKAFREMVPSGLEIDGDTAEVSGYCGEGWTRADGSRSTLRFDPNDLGTLELQKTGDGWVIYDYTGQKHYSSCGG
ncbi:hypothetical protein [Jidongwangia harbinensis]|uniref:hypothetical protein n=1 Tax=Jidongwangia harbinensis TaxID=2878561 RepID=UPI001CD97DF4|nr:hypothetical protein [Jidongwangia harbinensis]MCA2211298.1 hypothetical protein [Jidongwangia harbinensis]